MGMIFNCERQFPLTHFDSTLNVRHTFLAFEMALVCNTCFRYVPSKWLQCDRNHRDQLTDYSPLGAYMCATALNRMPFDTWQTFWILVRNYWDFYKIPNGDDASKLGSNSWAWNSTSNNFNVIAPFDFRFEIHILRRRFLSFTLLFSLLQRWNAGRKNHCLEMRASVPACSWMRSVERCLCVRVRVFMRVCVCECVRA